MPLHPTVIRVTERIRERSHVSRLAYLARIRQAGDAGGGAARARVSCTNLAHAMAATPANDKLVMRE